MKYKTLRKALIDREMSLSQLAARCGVRSETLSRIIHGWEKPREGLQERIAAVLRCDVGQLFPEDGQERR